jgi:hypothetical protein
VVFFHQPHERFFIPSEELRDEGRFVFDREHDFCGREWGSAWFLRQSHPYHARNGYALHAPDDSKKAVYHIEQQFFCFADVGFVCGATPHSENNFKKVCNGSGGWRNYPIEAGGITDFPPTPSRGSPATEVEAAPTSNATL